jgi:hypothetical protein
MKRALAVLYLMFLLWLLLFPPWDKYPYSSVKLDAVTVGLGHHWRFAVPKAPTELFPGDVEYWSHQAGQPIPSAEQRAAMGDKLPPITVLQEVRTAAIDIRLMVYEALLVLVLLSLVGICERPLVALWRQRSKLAHSWAFYCTENAKIQGARNQAPPI